MTHIRKRKTPCLCEDSLFINKVETVQCSNYTESNPVTGILTDFLNPGRRREEDT